MSERLDTTPVQTMVRNKSVILKTYTTSVCDCLGLCERELLTGRVIKRCKKTLQKAPRHIVAKLLAWVDLVEVEGMDEARIRQGYHYETLKGSLKGKRSVRLSKQWRAIYSIEQNKVEFVLVEKVTPHDYKK